MPRHQSLPPDPPEPDPLEPVEPEPDTPEEPEAPTAEPLAWNPEYRSMLDAPGHPLHHLKDA